MSELMSTTKKEFFPTWAEDLFDTGRFFSPRIMDFNRDFPKKELLGRMPSVNITESDMEFMIEMAAPGLERKDFKVVAENGVLCITSEKVEEKEETKRNYTRKEYSFNSFSRSFTLPENCVENKIDAKYNNGILSISIPKKEVRETKPAREIHVS